MFQENVAFTLNEARHLVQAAYDSKRTGKRTAIKEWFYIMISMNTGMRIAEIAHLKVESIDLENSIPLIKLRKGTRSRKGIKKTKNSFRNIPIGNKMVEIIKEYKQYKLSWGETWEAKEPLLRSPIYSKKNGYHYTRYGLYRMFKKVMNKTKYIRKKESFHPHSIRHTYAVLLLEINSKMGMSDPNFAMIGMMLGHKNPQTTMIYLKGLSGEVVKKSVNKLSKTIMTGIKE